jgi:hypothetical protein
MSVIPGIVLLPALILVILGILVKYFKVYWLISGYNTMSSEKKKNVDVVGLSRFTGNLCFAIAGIIGLAEILMIKEKMAAAGIIFALLFPISIYAMIKSQQYDGNTRNPNGTMKRKAKIKTGLFIAFLLITAIGVGILLYQSYQPIGVVITEEYLEIKGLYGEKIALTDITKVATIAELPEIIERTNGAALGERLKGNFRLKELGATKLFLDRGKPPFIYIERGTKQAKAKPLIINAVSEKETRELYDALFAAWKKTQVN